MKEPATHILPSPQFVLFGGELEVGDVVRAGDFVAAGARGWIQASPPFTEIVEGDPAVYVRLPVRNSRQLISRP